jgi:uncharacterized protein (TIGR03083 family)
MTVDPLTEMRYALAEGEASDVAAHIRSRVLAAVFADRPAGYPLETAEPISGAETFARMTARLDALLGELASDEWQAPTIRGLDVQQLVGHLLAVEVAFAQAVAGSDPPAEGDHVESTQEVAIAQAGRDPGLTRSEWAGAVAATRALVSTGRDRMAPVRMHGLTFGLDAFMVVRAFELWTHDEDIRRATRRPVADPDGAVLSRMTDLATTLLPAGVALAGGTGNETVRLVLTGPGGGTWDVELQGGVYRAEPGRAFQAHVTLDAAAFCRVVANRSNLEQSAPVLGAHEAPIRTLFAGAAALALD